MIPDHANPIRLPSPIGPPAPCMVSRGFVLAALLRLGLRREDIYLEALACNPMKYRVMVSTTLNGRPSLIVVTELSWARVLAAVRAHLNA